MKRKVIKPFATEAERNAIPETPAIPETTTAPETPEIPDTTPDPTTPAQPKENRPDVGQPTTPPATTFK